MSLPADLSMVTVTGAYVAGSGAVGAGTVTFVPSVAALRDPAGNVVVSLSPTFVTLDAAGHFSVSLAASDDANVVPSGWYYTVIERIVGHDQRSWMVHVPSNVTTIDLADMSEVTDALL